MNSMSMSAPGVYRGVPYTSRNSYYIGGGYHPAYSYGGWGDSWYHPAWYFWTPFHPAFYYSQPYYYNGGYYPGDFSFGRLILGVIIVLFAFWLIGKIFFRGGGSGGGGRGIKYTMYR